MITKQHLMRNETLLYDTTNSPQYVTSNRYLQEEDAPHSTEEQSDITREPEKRSDAIAEEDEEAAAESGDQETQDKQEEKEKNSSRPPKVKYASTNYKRMKH